MKIILFNLREDIFSTCRYITPAPLKIQSEAERQIQYVPSYFWVHYTYIYNCTLIGVLMNSETETHTRNYLFFQWNRDNLDYRKLDWLIVFAFRPVFKRYFHLYRDERHLCKGYGCKILSLWAVKDIYRAISCYITGPRFKWSHQKTVP